MTYRLNEYLIVKVPEGAWGFQLSRSFYASSPQCLDYSTGAGNSLSDMHDIPLPEGHWDYVCKGTEVDEVMAGEMVDKVPAENDMGGFDTCYKEYVRDRVGLLTALESFASYLTANSLTAASIAVLKLK